MLCGVRSTSRSTKTGKSWSCRRVPHKSVNKNPGAGGGGISRALNFRQLLKDGGGAHKTTEHHKELKSQNQTGGAFCVHRL